MTQQGYVQATNIINARKTYALIALSLNSTREEENNAEKKSTYVLRKKRRHCKHNEDCYQDQKKKKTNNRIKECYFRLINKRSK